MRVLIQPHESRVEKWLVYTPSLALKRTQYRFRHRCSGLAVHLLHEADEWTGPFGRPPLCCQNSPDQAPAAS
jgi:hypothetical protein